MTVLDPVFPVASELLSCVCAALEGTIDGSVCRCSLEPGHRLIADFCGGMDCGAGAGACSGDGHGQATVRVLAVYPIADVFPARPTAPSPCNSSPRLAADFAITILRCGPTVDAKGNAPTADQLTDAVARQLSDAAAVRQAILCCLGGTRCERQRLLQAWRPEGGGGCMGGTTTVTVEIGTCGCQ